MFRFNKTKSLKSWKSVFVIASLSLCFTLLFFATIIDPYDNDNEIEKKKDNRLPLLSQKEEIHTKPKLEGRAGGIDVNKDPSVNQVVEGEADGSEVSRSAPVRINKNSQKATEPDVKTKAPATTKAEVKTKEPSATESTVKTKTPDVPKKESSTEQSYSAEDLDLLARLIHAEAQGEPYEAKVAVGAVVLNRIGPFAGSIKEVIYQKIDGYYQFTPVENGWINKPAGEESIKAAKEALNGVDPTNGALFYYDNQTTNEWIMAKPVSVTFGNMIYAY